MTQEQISNKLRSGMEMEKDNTVSRELTARVVGSGGLDVLATPALAAWIENAAYEMADLWLPEEETTVGANINFDHMAPTPVGMKVRVKVHLDAIEGRKLVFSIEAYDTTQQIAGGTHTRFIVNKARFMQKVQDKKNQ